MTQPQLDRAVARLTGETVETIQCRGFTYVPSPKRRRHRHPRRRHARTGTSHPPAPPTAQRASICTE
jgi:hypothetical protein